MTNGPLCACCAFLGLVAGCAHLPELAPLSEPAENEALAERCTALAPRAAFRAVHALEARLPFDQASTMLGVSAADPASGRLRAALVSAEGFTLFEGLRDASGAHRVLRAVPPLDAHDFGPMLLDDVALVLLAPRGDWLEIGRDERGLATCRARARSASAPGGTLDLAPAGAGGPVLLRLYDARERLRREVRLEERNPLGLFARARLEAPGAGGYTLDLRLLEAEPLAPDDPALAAE